MKGLFFVLAFLSLSQFMIACSSKDVTGKTEAETLYKQALESFQNERYLVATEKLGQLKGQYPYSYYATHAELLQADILFQQKSYAESTSAYLTFRDAHPKHEKLAYVIFRIAESYFKQLPTTFDRDLSPAGEAVKYYEEVIEKYPNSEYAPTATSQRAICLEMILNKEKYIADFYYKTDVYDAALWRYLEIIQNIKDPALVNHAKLRTIMTSQKLNKFDDCLNYGSTFMSDLAPDDKKKAEEIVAECEKAKASVVIENNEKKM